LIGTDETADSLEQTQFTTGEGPCVDASSFGVPVLVDDLDHLGAAHAGRWPAFVDEAIGLGVRAIFALPLRVGAVSFGAADLYRRTPGPLRGQDLSRALTVIDSVALAVVGSQESTALDHDGDGVSLRNVEVHQAAGMLMMQLDISIDQALVRLRATAFAEGVPVENVAADVIRRRRRFKEGQP
jgi:hypothetical protein